MRVVVTGGAGFIGSHIVDRLVAADHDVVVLDSLDPGAHSNRPDYLNPGASYRWADVRDADAVGDVCVGADALSHQAARVGLGVDFADIDGYVSSNDQGTAVLLRVLFEQQFTGRFVLASSMVVYGEGRYRCARHGVVRPGPRLRSDLEAGRFEPPCPVCGDELTPEAIPEDAPVDPRNVYAATKLHQEHLVNVFGRERNNPVTHLRYHNVYGSRMPRDTPYAGVASIFRSALAAGQAPQVHEDGRQRRDFVHVSDVADANVLALTADANVVGPFNVCSGVPRSVGDMARALASAMDGPAPERSGRYRLGDVRHVFASPARATEILGFTAQVALDDGMVEFAHADLRQH